METNFALTGTPYAATENGIYVKKRGNDGDTSKQWIATSANHWWYIDLGGEKTFYKVSVMTGPVSYSFDIRGSHDPGPLFNVWDAPFVIAGAAVRNSLIDFPLTPSQIYRWLKISFTDGANWSTLHEMQIWGHEDEEMIETLIYTALTGNAAIAQRVNTRVYPVVMPQDVTLPAISYQRVSADPVNHLEGYSGLKNAHIVINAWARNYDDVKGLASDIHAAMNAATTFRCVLSNELDGYDPDVSLYVISQDFSCWGQE